MSSETILPREQWEQVLVNIPPKDLCSVVATSSYMYDMASWTNLWNETKVNIRKVKTDGLAQLFTINRFKNVRNINFRGISFTGEEMERVLREIPETPLEHIDLSGVNLNQMSAELLAKAVCNLKTVNLSGTMLTTHQCVRLFEAFTTSSTLTLVSLRHIDIRGVPTELVTRTISNLQTTDLWGAKVTADQFVEVLETSQSSKNKVKVHPAGIYLPELETNQSMKVLSAMYKAPHGSLRF